MFLHPSSILFLFLIILSTLMIMSADSWMMMWLFLEINLLLFIPLLFSKKNKYQSEASLKYFINQAMSSVMILSASTFLMHNYSLSSMLMISAFALKMGVAPLHSWMIIISGSLPWLSLWLLFVPQKVAPMLVMGTLSKESNFIFWLCFIVLSSMIGALGGLTTSSMKKLVTYSSISHMAWLMTGLAISVTAWLIYFMIYSFITSIILYSLSFMKVNKINDILASKDYWMKNLMMLNMLTISGMPPFSGFLMKLSLILKITESSWNLILAPLILSSLISLFFYTRVFYTNLLGMSSKKSKEENSTKNLVLIMTLVSMLMGNLCIF